MNAPQPLFKNHNPIEFQVKRYRSYAYQAFLIILLVLFSQPLLSAEMGDESGIEQIARVPMQENYVNSLRYRWLGKPVEVSKVVHDMEDLAGWSASGIASIELTGERSIDGTSSLRFKTPLRDEALIARTPGGRMMGSVGASLKFEQPQDWSDYNRIFLWVYIHSTDVRVHTFYLSFTCQDAPSGITTPHYNSVIQGLTPGQWNPVFWEIPNLKRDKVTEFRILKLATGNDPVEGDHVVYDFDHLELQKVQAEVYEGWEVAPGRMAYNHAGYKPEQTKIAIVTGPTPSHFQLRHARSGQVVLTKAVKQVENEQGNFGVLDFSEIHKPGEYILWVGQTTSRPFRIDENLWLDPIRKILNCYFALRCGYDVPGIHPECHKDCMGSWEGVTKPINGGWHDAGDLSQGSFRTGMSVYAMMDLLQQLERRNLDPDLQKQLLDEGLWGLDWILKTRFGDGYRMTWNSMGIYTDGIRGTTDDVTKTPQNNPWENFTASAAEALAYATLKDRRPEIARQSLKAAREDWEAAAKMEHQWLDEGQIVLTGDGMVDNKVTFYHRWFSGGTYLTLSWGIISSVHLYEITGDDRYAAKAVDYAQHLLDCQERGFPDGIPLTGFFYTSPKKLAIVNHRHGAFEESPLLALAAVCEAFPDHKDWIQWYGAAVLHSEYLLKRGSKFTAPYCVLPAAVFRKSDIMAVPGEERREAMLRQFNSGTRLSGEYSLRKFPIWSTRTHHGNLAVGLSQTLALAAATRLRADQQCENLAALQIQWALGGNPFAQSLMFGEGYDYPPLYGYNPGDIVGALPVGIDSVQNDEPFWSGSNHSTYKEIWVVPVSRFLWNAVYLGVPASVRGELKSSEVTSLTFSHRAMKISKEVPLSSSGRFEALLPAGEYDVQAGSSHWTLSVVSGGNYDLALDAEKWITLANSKKENQDNSQVLIQVEATGKGSHEIQLRVFNGKVDQQAKQVTLIEGQPQKIEWKVAITDPKSPWVAVIIPDHDLNRKQELTGILSNM